MRSNSPHPLANVEYCGDHCTCVPHWLADAAAARQRSGLANTPRLLLLGLLPHSRWLCTTTAPVGGLGGGGAGGGGDGEAGVDGGGLGAQDWTWYWPAQFWQ